MPVAERRPRMTLEPNDPMASAEEAGLRYITDAMPGIRRRRAGRGFSYIGPDGERITDENRLNEIRALAIPPAWSDVWISPLRRGHIQATGRDARSRKQYRYHRRWREIRDEAKYGRLTHPPPDGSRPPTPRAPAREGARARRSPPRGDPHPGRQRRVRA